MITKKTVYEIDLPTLKGTFDEVQAAGFLEELLNIVSYEPTVAEPDEEVVE